MNFNEYIDLSKKIYFGIFNDINIKHTKEHEDTINESVDDIIKNNIDIDNKDPRIIIHQAYFKYIKNIYTNYKNEEEYYYNMINEIYNDKYNFNFNLNVLSKKLSDLRNNIKNFLINEISDFEQTTEKIKFDNTKSNYKRPNENFGIITENKKTKVDNEKLDENLISKKLTDSTSAKPKPIDPTYYFIGDIHGDIFILLYNLFNIIDNISIFQDLPQQQYEIIKILQSKDDMNHNRIYKKSIDSHIQFNIPSKDITENIFDLLINYDFYNIIINYLSNNNIIILLLGDALDTFNKPIKIYDDLFEYLIKNKLEIKGNSFFNNVYKDMINSNTKNQKTCFTTNKKDINPKLFDDYKKQFKSDQLDKEIMKNKYKLKICNYFLLKFNNIKDFINNHSKALLQINIYICQFMNYMKEDTYTDEFIYKEIQSNKDIKFNEVNVSNQKILDFINKIILNYYNEYKKADIQYTHYIENIEKFINCNKNVKSKDLNKQIFENKNIIVSFNAICNDFINHIKKVYSKIDSSYINNNIEDIIKSYNNDIEISINSIYNYYNSLCLLTNIFIYMIFNNQNSKDISQLIYIHGNHDKRKYYILYDLLNILNEDKKNKIINVDNKILNCSYKNFNKIINSKEIYHIERLYISHAGIFKLKNDNSTIYSDTLIDDLKNIINPPDSLNKQYYMLLLNFIDFYINNKYGYYIKYNDKYIDINTNRIDIECYNDDEAFIYGDYKYHTSNNRDREDQVVWYNRFNKYSKLHYDYIVYIPSSKNDNYEHILFINESKNPNYNKKLCVIKKENIDRNKIYKINNSNFYLLYKNDNFHIVIQSKISLYYTCFKKIIDYDDLINNLTNKNLIIIKKSDKLILPFQLIGHTKDKYLRFNMNNIKLTYNNELVKILTNIYYVFDKHNNYINTIDLLNTFYNEYDLHTSCKYYIEYKKDEEDDSYKLFKYDDDTTKEEIEILESKTIDLNTKIKEGGFSQIIDDDIKLEYEKSIKSEETENKKLRYTNSNKINENIINEIELIKNHVNNIQKYFNNINNLLLINLLYIIDYELFIVLLAEIYYNMNFLNNLLNNNIYIQQLYTILKKKQLIKNLSGNTNKKLHIGGMINNIIGGTIIKFTEKQDVIKFLIETYNITDSNIINQLYKLVNIFDKINQDELKQQFLNIFNNNEQKEDNEQSLLSSFKKLFL